MLSRPERLTSREFDGAFAASSASRTFRNGLLSLRVCWRADSPSARPSAGTRAAFVVPKKLGKATWRNRTRRRMQEAFRLQREELQVLAGEVGALDCIFLATPETHGADFEALQDSVLALLGRAVADRHRQRRVSHESSASAATQTRSRASSPQD